MRDETVLMNDVLVGRTDEGSRVYVRAALVQSYATQETVTHETIQGSLRLSMSGCVVDKGRRNASSAGQCLDELLKVTTPARPFTMSDVRTLHKLWKRWHLNDLRSHCAHQDWGVAWDAVPPCEHTGYRAGYAWLVEPLPADGTGTVEGDPLAVLRFIARKRPTTRYMGN